jgi:murein DD-endopeptidase MepM/ murein hydrolase activator NlpD
MFYAIWFIPYAVFFFFFTGPENLKNYPPQKNSPYKLPWKHGISRLVAQGNRSFTSHRGLHQYAWDFVMPIGTEVLAARDGRVREVQDNHDGIGLDSNIIVIDHSDGDCSGYAHIKNNGALVHVGDSVKQGQPIALSGMVGQTWFPHLHFFVTNQNCTIAKAISFSEVPGGIPLAGRFYTSENPALGNWQK